MYTSSKKKKSNIFAYTELKKMIENLEKCDTDLRTTIIRQTPYFYLLEARYFSEDLAIKWTELRKRIGYFQCNTQYERNLLRKSIYYTVRRFTEAECLGIIHQLRGIFEEVVKELDTDENAEMSENMLYKILAKYYTST
jgi:hypothetical protein